MELQYLQNDEISEEKPAVMDIALSEALNMEVINIKAPEGTAPAKGIVEVTDKDGNVQQIPYENKEYMKNLKDEEQQEEVNNEQEEVNQEEVNNKDENINQTDNNSNNKDENNDEQQENSDKQEVNSNTNQDKIMIKKIHQWINLIQMKILQKKRVISVKMITLQHLHIVSQH